MPQGTCNAEGCGRPIKCQGRCGRCYQRGIKNGSVVVRPRPNYGSGRSVMSGGYVRVWSPGHPEAFADGYVLEHRKVAHDTWGPIPEGYDVHHINHDRQDNRPENLRVVSRSQHASDHARAAGTITNQYGTWPLRSFRGGEDGTSTRHQ